MSRLEVTIQARDGICPASVFTPNDTAGPWPAVIFFMDGFGIRPVMREMAQRLADGGYLVLMSDLYYRIGSYLPMDPPRIVANPKLREEFMKLVTSLNREQKVRDAGAFIVPAPDPMSGASGLLRQAIAWAGMCH
jgi:carboxymethylenebutenolidase